MPDTRQEVTRLPAHLAASHVSVWYHDRQVLRDISLEIPERQVTALIGPSGCGKSTFLRCFNRMNEGIDGARTEGTITFRGINIHGSDVDPIQLRRRVGMVFQRSNPFPKSIYENAAYGLRLLGRLRRADLDEAVERCLRQAALWDEVKDRLHSSALSLSAGEQQRLCIARALAVQPEVLLMDEPASALDPTATSRIEELLLTLKRRYTLVVVTHNMHQAIRISDQTAFLHLGELVESGPTRALFTNPRHRKTEDYVTGRLG